MKHHFYTSTHGSLPFLRPSLLVDLSVSMAHLPHPWPQVPHVLRSDSGGGYTHTNFIIIARNNQQWWATLFEENFNDYYISLITCELSCCLLCIFYFFLDMQPFYPHFAPYFLYIFICQFIFIFLI